MGQIARALCRLRRAGCPFAARWLGFGGARGDGCGHVSDWNHGDWRVEAIDHENEGVVYVTIFSGPDSRERADEYAAMKNAQEARLLRIVS